MRETRLSSMINNRLQSVMLSPYRSCLAQPTPSIALTDRKAGINSSKLIANTVKFDLNITERNTSQEKRDLLYPALAQFARLNLML
jgi:hypothetical protein